MKVKILRIAAPLLMHLATGKFEVVANRLPDDAELHEVWIDYERRQVCLTIQSELFDDIPEYNIIPDLEPPVIKSIEDDA